jgi:2-(1,2-epoxy-1,2-dihydrophenyl)acetyl-CoA isomerase
LVDSTRNGFEQILFSVSDRVATITLNRPSNFNALTLTMARDLHLAAIECDEDPSIRAVVVTGAGKAFFAGGDLASFEEAGDDRGRLIKELTTYFHAAISRFNRMDAPVLAAVNGVAAGAGFSFLLSVDLAVAAKSAKFTMAYTKAGLTPDGSSSYFLPRIVGLRRAHELTLTNRTLSASEALEWGIVNEVVDDAETLPRTLALATELASGPTRSLGDAKRLMREGTDESLESQMEREARCITASAMRNDGREGVAAFIEKRAPMFRGD